MKVRSTIACVVLLLASPLAAAEPAGKVAVRPVRIIENRGKDLEGKDDDLPFNPGLTVTLELSGAPVRKATHWGKLAIAKGVDDRDAALDLLREPSEDLEEIRRMPAFSFGNDPAPKKPEDKVRLDLAFKLPARGAAALKLLEGSLVLRVSEKKDVILKAPEKLAGKPIEDRTLKAAGVTLELVEFTPEGSEYAKFKAQDPQEKIAELDFIDAKGKSLVSSRGSMGDGSGSKEMSIGGFEKLHPDARLKITVIASREDLPVPFRLENLQLP